MARPRRAYEAIKPFLESDNANSQIVCMFAKLSGSLGKGKEALSRIEHTLKDTHLTVQQRIDLHFRAAEIHNRNKDYEKAMENYNKANALKPVTFDLQQHAELIDDLIDSFTREAFAELPQAAITSDRPVFILGMPRSGTSLVEQILSCHNGIYGAGELMEIGSFATELGFRIGTPAPAIERLESLSQSSLDKVARQYLAKLEQLSSDEDRVTDKMPGNYLWLGLIQLLFPGARIIHTCRNPLDACLSCYFTDFNGVHEYAYDLDDLGHYYCEYRRLMEHWHGVLSVPILDVAYEELVTNTEEVSRTIVEFCGLGWDPGVLNFHESEWLVSTASYLQVKKPIYTSSIGRWNSYAKYLAPLQEVLECGQH